MAKLTKKQEAQYERIVKLLHELIRAKHDQKRSDYEETINQIREEVKEDDTEK